MFDLALRITVFIATGVISSPVSRRISGTFPSFGVIVCPVGNERCIHSLDDDMSGDTKLPVATPPSRN
jgi:hypothetical protein